MKDPVFKNGDKVTPIYTNGYTSHLTMGKVYVVSDYTPTDYDGVFTWPAYVDLVGELGVNIRAHARRFKKVDQ